MSDRRDCEIRSQGRKYLMMIQTKMVQKSNGGTEKRKKNSEEETVGDELVLKEGIEGLNDNQYKYENRLKTEKYSTF